MRRLVLLSAIVMAVAGPALAQDTLPPWLGGLTSSLGQPPRRHGYASVGLGFDGGRGAQFEPDPIIVGGLGITKDLSNPVTSVLAGSVETFLSARGRVVDGGPRSFFVSPALRLSAGIEYRARDDRLAPFFGLTMPVRRGGVFGGGTLLRAEFVPRDKGIARLSVLVPIAQPRAGRTRPRSDRIDVTVRPSAAIARPACPAGPARARVVPVHPPPRPEQNRRDVARPERPCQRHVWARARGAGAIAARARGGGAVRVSGAAHGDRRGASGRGAYVA